MHVSLFSVGVSALVASVYVQTCYPTVAGGDSPEMVAMAWQLGVPHPPGYPLFTITAHVFMKYILIVHDPAWRCNVFCALLGSAAAGLLCSLAVRWTGGSYAAGLLTGLLYAFSGDVWLYSVQGGIDPCSVTPSVLCSH